MHRSIGLVSSLVLSVTLGLAQRQQSFGEPYDGGLFKPLESLSAISDTTFTTLAHPTFPNHSVRVRKTTQFCDPTANSYTGRNPEEDDVIFWTNGGPGGSSVMGLFLEHGPCRIVDEHGPKYHPESWNNNANIFYVDQPVGVGYSYADYGEKVSTSEEAAIDMAAFIVIFRPLYRLCWSAVPYGRRLEEVGMTPVNISSIIIGNGYTDFYTLYEAKFEFPCIQTRNPLFFLSRNLPRCLKMLKSSCVDIFDDIACGAAAQFCDTELEASVWRSGVNIYDVTQRCPAEKAEIPCTPILNHTRDYLRRNTTRAILGADAAVPWDASIANPAVGQDFIAQLDLLRPAQHHVAALLERGVRALIFAGTNDWICNYLGNERWTSDLQWFGHDEFNSQKMRVWEVDGLRAGEVRDAQGLTFATVEGAGHLAPYNKPKETLAMLNRSTVRRKQDLHQACLKLDLYAPKSASLARLRTVLIDYSFPDQDSTSTAPNLDQTEVNLEFSDLGDDDDEALVAQFAVEGADAEEILGYDDEDELEEELEEQERLLDSDEAFNEYKRTIRLEENYRFEQNRRAGGRSTQASIIRDWEDFVSDALSKGQIRDRIIDEHHLLLYIRHCAERCKRDRRRMDIEGTFVGARIEDVGKQKSLELFLAEAAIAKRSENGLNATYRVAVDISPLMAECTAGTFAAGCPVTFIFVFDGPERPKIKREHEVQHKALVWEQPVRKIISSFGYYAHNAPGEAEAELAELNRHGVVDTVLTSDSDIFVFGASTVLRMLPKAARKKFDDEVQLFTSNSVQSRYSNRNELIMFALLCGGDYDKGIPNCGPATAYHLLDRGFGSQLCHGFEFYQGQKLDEFLVSWRNSLSVALNMKVPVDFPSSTVLQAYMNPITSWSKSASVALPSWVSLCSEKEFARLVWPGVFLQMLYSPLALYDQSKRLLRTPNAYVIVLQNSRQVRQGRHGLGAPQPRMTASTSNLISLMNRGYVSDDRDTVSVWVPAATYLPEELKLLHERSACEAEPANEEAQHILTPPAEHNRHSGVDREVIDLTHLDDDDNNQAPKRWLGFIDLTGNDSDDDDNKTIVANEVIDLTLD